jgi:radical SAM protein with 4Fe4S-binding SPASM domain
MHSPLRHSLAIFHKAQPIHLTLFLTKRCNARCPYCFYLQSEHTSPCDADELDIDELQRISQSFHNLLWLAFSGGEIFLRKDLVEISELFHRQNNPVFMLYPTNGLMPALIKHRTEQILQSCKNSVIAVKLSIDDLYEEHDKLRNTPNSFQKTLKTYERLAPLLAKYPNFELGVNTVFCSKNQNNMPAIIDYVHGLKNINTHTISLVRGDLVHSDYKEVDMEKYRQATEYLAQNTRQRQDNIYRFRGARLKAAQDILQRRLILQTMQQNSRQISCYAGLSNIVVTESGDVYPCEIRSDSFGNIRDFDYRIERLLKTSRARNILDSIKQKQCHCTHECNFMTNILLNPKMYPDLLNEYRKIKSA